MNLRDYFAGCYISGAVGSGDLSGVFNMPGRLEPAVRQLHGQAYSVADALLEINNAREKELNPSIDQILDAGKREPTDYSQS